jgi:hypothetical protein
MSTKYTNDRKIDQMVVKYANICDCKTLQKFLFENMLLCYRTTYSLFTYIIHFQTLKNIIEETV